VSEGSINYGCRGKEVGRLAAWLITLTCGTVYFDVVELLMIPHGQPSSLSRQPYNPGYSQFAAYPPRPAVPEDMLKALAIQVERKTIVVKLNENRRGRFLRIQEENEVKRNCVIIPVSGLAEFKRLIDEMVKANSEIPAKSQNGSA
jgi:hypothetical protein